MNREPNYSPISHTADRKMTVKISYDELFGNLSQTLATTVSLQPWHQPLDADKTAYFKEVFAGAAL